MKSFELLTKVSPIAAAPQPPARTPDAAPTVAVQEPPSPAAEPPARGARPARNDARPGGPGTTSTAPAQPGSSSQVPPPTARRPARTARVQSRAPGRGADGDRVMQTADAGPDPSKPAELSIDAGEAAANVIERPAPDGNEKDRFREAAPQRGLLVGMRVGFEKEVGSSKVASIQPIFQAGGALGGHAVRNGRPRWARDGGGEAGLCGGWNQHI